MRATPAVSDDRERIDADVKAAWVELLAALQDAAATIAGPRGVASEVELAEGYRFVTHLLRGACELFLEDGDARRPRFVRPIGPSQKWFADNPDTVYDNAPIHGGGEYVVSASACNADLITVCVHAGGRGGGANRVATSLTEVARADDGSLTITLGGARVPGNWLALPADATSVQVRQYFLDRSRAHPAVLSIRAADDPGSAPPLDAARLRRRLHAVGSFVRRAATATTAHADEIARSPNQLRQETTDSAAPFFPAPGTDYIDAWYRIDEAQALVVTGRPPTDARYWSVLLMNRWMQSLDERAGRTSINGREMALEPDGSFRVVVAHRDPGARNWLDASGHAQGYLLVRWVGASSAPNLALDVRPLTELRP